MPIPTVVNNLVLIDATLSITSTCFLTFMLAFLLKIFFQRVHYGKHIRNHDAYKEYEANWYFTVAWGGACFMTALMYSLLFDEIYQIPDVVYSTTVNLALYPIYMLMMFFWVVCVFVLRKSPRLGFVFIFFAVACAAINMALIFLIHGSDWTRWLNVLLFVPPLFAVFATNSDTTFQTVIIKGIDGLKGKSAEVYAFVGQQPQQQQNGGQVPWGNPTSMSI